MAQQWDTARVEKALNCLMHVIFSMLLTLGALEIALLKTAFPVLQLMTSTDMNNSDRLTVSSGSFSIVLPDLPLNFQPCE